MSIHPKPSAQCSGEDRLCVHVPAPNPNLQNPFSSRESAVGSSERSGRPTERTGDSGGRRVPAVGGGARAPLRTQKPRLQSDYSRKKEKKNIAKEETGSRLSPGRLPALIAPGRPGRGAHPEVARGSLRPQPAPRSRGSCVFPASPARPPGWARACGRARDVRDPPVPRAASAPRPAQPRAYSADSALPPGRGRGVPARSRGASSCVSAEAS